MDAAVTSASLWKDDETCQNQRIPAVMLKLKLIPAFSRTGSVLDLRESRGKLFPLCFWCFLVHQMIVVDIFTALLPPDTRVRTEPALIRTGSR